MCVLPAAIQSERDRTEKLLAEAAERQRELEERMTKMMEEDGMDGVADGGGRRRVGWRGCFGAHGVRMGKREVERKEGVPRRRPRRTGFARRAHSGGGEGKKTLMRRRRRWPI